ncbi:hypothetical protein LTR95_005745 [Oleoguttula sp. CCFEE 5521]
MVLSSLKNIEPAAKKRKAAAVKEETTEALAAKKMKLSVKPAAPVAAVKETEPAVKAERKSSRAASVTRAAPKHTMTLLSRRCLLPLSASVRFLQQPHAL